jgi:hypothetical protein
MHHHQVVLLSKMLDLVEILLVCSCRFSNSSWVRYFLSANGVLAKSYAFLASASGSPAERNRTVTLAISDRLIAPAGREFGSRFRLLPGRGT